MFTYIKVCGGIMKRAIRIVLLMGAITMCLLLSGCKSDKVNKEKVKDLEFTVVEEADIPEELLKIIEEKKKEPFKLKFSNTAYLYIVVGYGEQPTGGYSIKVEDLYLTENAIYFNTSLLGPPKDEIVTQILTYPYIVVKVEFMDKSVVFE